MSTPEENSISLARIDERTKLLTEKIRHIEATVNDLKIKLDVEFEKKDAKDRELYITKDTFLPVQRAMFAAISTLVAAVVMAAINFAFRT